jgi:hypothetical protein
MAEATTCTVVDADGQPVEQMPDAVKNLLRAGQIVGLDPREMLAEAVQRASDYGRDVTDDDFGIPDPWGQRADFERSIHERIDRGDFGSNQDHADPPR